MEIVESVISGRSANVVTEGNYHLVISSPCVFCEGAKITFFQGKEASTSSDFKIYDILFGPFDADLSYCEVGAGLGGLIPKIARQSSTRPIVIDPMNYEMAQKMLEHYIRSGRRMGLEKAEEVHDRVRVYLNPSLVQLINVPFEKVSEVGICDFVVDLHGPSHHAIESGEDEEHYSLEEKYAKLARIRVLSSGARLRF